MRRNKNYTEQFKREAVALSERLGNVLKAAQQLGTTSASIVYWKKQLGIKKEAVIKPEDPQQELERLRKENLELQKANEILKRAAAFFSQDHLK